MGEKITVYIRVPWNVWEKALYCSIFFHYLCSQPDYAAVRATCNLWRNYNDVQDSWDSVLDIIDHYGKDDGNFSAYAGPGGWNDPDEVSAFFTNFLQLQRYCSYALYEFP